MVQIKRHTSLGNRACAVPGQKRRILSVAWLFAVGGALPIAAQRPATPPDTLAIRGDTYFLAHDALLGRATGSRGAELAATYIVSRCIAMGLEPVAGRYLHAVPLQLASAVPASDVLTIETPERRYTFGSPHDVLIDLESARTLEAFQGPLVRTESSLPDGEPQDVEGISGRIVAVEGLLADRARTGDVLKARGAEGLVQLVDSASFAELAARWSGRVHVVLARDVPASLRTSLPAVVASPRVAASLAAGGGLVRVRPPVRSGPFTAHNVACRLPGSTSQSAPVHLAFVAHYDHLGVQHTLDSDSIYNGFSDNAAGVAMVLAIADVLRRHPLRASALFLFFAAEELGLLGSDYFVETSPIPVDQIGLVLNLDAGAPPAPLSSWRIATSDARLAELATRVGAARGWSVLVSPARPNSDHFAFARHGVPAGLLVPGPDSYDGFTTERSDSLRARWERYHQPGDEWSPAFPWSGLRRYAEVALALARAADSAFADTDPASDQTPRGRGLSRPPR